MVYHVQYKLCVFGYPCAYATNTVQQHFCKAKCPSMSVANISKGAS